MSADDPDRSDALPSRLDSWKEIAAYLNRDVSTVQRWEKREAMPVHRHLHDKLWSVYAFRSELDAWWRNRSARAGYPTRGPHAEVDPSIETERIRNRAVGSAWLIASAGGVVVLSVALVISVSVLQAPRGAGAVDPAAEQQYLVGRYYLWRFDEENLKRAVEHFDRATQISPDYAPAFAALSNAWWARGMFGPIGLRDVEAAARRAADTALKLDDRLAAAYIAQADIKRLYDRDSAGAEDMALRALTLDPQSVEAHHSYALLLMALGRFPEALAHIARAAELDPLAPAIHSNFARILYRAGRFEDALLRMQRALQLEPGMQSHYARLGDIYEQLGQYDKALEAYHQVGDRGSMHKARVARVYALMGRRQEASLLLDDLACDSACPGLSLVAAAHAALGDTKRAAAVLTTLVERRDPGLPYFPVDPKFASLRSAPEWPDLLRRTTRIERR